MGGAVLSAGPGGGPRAVRLESLIVQRWLLGAGAALCAALTAAALYLQHVVGLEPCPLCIVQRVLVVALGVVLAAAAVHDPGPGWRRGYGALVAMVGGLGTGVAARHVWLQNLPADRVPECGPGLEYMLETFPLTETLAMVLRGSGECAEVQWTFLGLTIPGWTLVVFTGLTLYGLALLLSRAPERGR